MTPFKVVTADCPWLFGDQLPDSSIDATGLSRGASKQYPCMTIDELKAFQLPPLTDDAVLFFWRVASMQLEALQVIHAWNFNAPQSELVWLKKTKYGKRWFGMGRTVRMEHEICLIAKRGKPQVNDHSVRSVIETGDPCRVCSGNGEYLSMLMSRVVCSACNGSGVADIDGFDATVGRHSEKPDTFFKTVETLYNGPYVELFSRKQRDGWTCLGNEVKHA